MKVGIGYIDSAAANATVQALFGADAAIYEGDARANAQAVIDDVNATGGLAGRQAEPVYHAYSPQSYVGGSSSRAQAEQEMCATFTEDVKVFAIIPVVSVEGVMANCAKHHDVPIVATTNGEEPVDEGRFSEIGGWWYAPTWMSVDRRDRAYVQGIIRQDFLPRDAVIGLMTWDRPAVRRSTEKTLKPGLAAAGFRVAREVVFPDVIESDWSVYVLQLRSAGVTHVLWSYCSCSTLPQVLFMSQAESQEYRARHFLSTDHSLDLIRANGAPPNQLKGAQAIGWSPRFDLGGTRPPINDGDDRCRRALRAQGIHKEDTPVEPYCDGLYFLQAALRERAATTSALRLGAESLRDTRLPGTFRSEFAPGRHDGAAELRDVVFDDSCTCWVYVGAPRAAPD